MNLPLRRGFFCVAYPVREIKSDEIELYGLVQCRSVNTIGRKKYESQNHNGVHRVQTA